MKTIRNEIMFMQIWLINQHHMGPVVSFGLNTSITDSTIKYRKTHKTAIKPTIMQMLKPRSSLLASDASETIVPLLFYLLERMVYLITSLSFLSPFFLFMGDVRSFCLAPFS